MALQTHTAPVSPARASRAVTSPPPPRRAVRRPSSSRPYSRGPRLETRTSARPWLIRSTLFKLEVGEPLDLGHEAGGPPKSLGDLGKLYPLGPPAQHSPLELPPAIP